MIEILLAIIGILGLLFGFEKSKNKKKDKTIEKQEQVIVHHAKQNEVYETHQEISKEAQKALNEIKPVEIKEDMTDAQIIDTANDIIDTWNKRL